MDVISVPMYTGRLWRKSIKLKVGDYNLEKTIFQQSFLVEGIQVEGIDVFKQIKTYPSG